MFKRKSNFTELKRLENFYTDGKIQLTSDGQLALCCQHHTVNVLNLQTGNIEFSIAHEDKSKISSFHLTADDKYLFTGNNEFLIRQWNFTEHSLVKTWRSDHKAPIVCMDSILDDTKDGGDGNGLLCTGSSDATARVFDYGSKNVKNIFRKHSGVVNLVKFHAEQQLITSCASYAIKIWSLVSNKCLRVLDGHFSAVTSVAFSKANNLLYSASRDKVVMIWNLSNYSSRTIAVFESIEEIVLLEGGGEEVKKMVKEHYQDDHLVVAGNKGKLSVWNAVKGIKVLPTDGKNDVSNDGIVIMETDCLLQCLRGVQGCLVTVTAEQVVAVYRLHDLALLKQFSGNNDQVLDIKFLNPHNTDPHNNNSEDLNNNSDDLNNNTRNDYLAVATNSHKLRLYHTKDWSCSLYDGHTDVIVAVETMLAADGVAYVATASKDNTVRLWKVATDPSVTLTCVGVAEGHLHTVSCVAFIKIASKSDCRTIFLASGSSDKTLRIWKYTASPSQQQHKQNNDENIKNKDGEEGEDDDSNDHATRDLKVKLSIEAHADDINHVSVSPDSKVIATASRDKSAKIWDRSDLKLLGVLKGHKRGVWTVEFSPVNKVVATSSADTTIKLWELTSFSCIKSLEQHQASVLKSFFMSGEAQIISGDSSGCLKLWDVKTKACERSLDCHDDKMWALALNQSQCRIATGDADGVIVYWSMVTKEEADQEAAAKMKDLKLKEQQLENLMHAGSYSAALSLAISLDQPRRTLQIVTFLWEQKEGKLESTLSALNDSLIRSLLEYTVVWSRDHLNYVVCESIHYHYLRTLPPEQFMALDNGQHLLDNLFLNSKKIYGKWKQLNMESTFISFLLRTMNLQSTAVPILTNVKKKTQIMEVDEEDDSSEDSD